MLISAPLFLYFCCFSQKQANNWYFGNRAGLDFNQLPPVALNNSVSNSDEGSAAISDQNGQLLFYTNGVTVINRTHVLMKNGGGLLGASSSTDNTIIVPGPGNDSIYYLFTVGAVYQQGKGLRCNIINMKGDGGFGELINKNILVDPNAIEKLAAVKHCNKKDVWVVFHKWNSDEYHAYLITAAGLSANPVISHTGLVITNNEDNSIGKLKFSIDGKKLAAAHSYENNLIELMDFDNTTGIITNPVVFRPTPAGTPNAFTGGYAAEFSPNGRFLYVSDNYTNDGSSALYQFDISSGNAAGIVASRQLIFSPDQFAGALQIGPDLKIYMAIGNDIAISVIEDPDQPGISCNFSHQKISIRGSNGGQIKFGLPNFIQSYFDAASNPYEFSRSGNCTDLNISFSISRISGIDSVKWDFGDGQFSTLLQPTHTYATAGFYDVTLIVFKTDCSLLNDIISHRIWIADSETFLGADTSACNVLSLQIGVAATLGADNYLWNTGFTGNQITTTGFGDYWLELEQNGCKMRDTITVSPRPKPTVNVGRDTTICRFAPVVLQTTSGGYDRYLWNTGDSSASILINQVGTYFVTVTKDGCEASDTVEVSLGDCDIYIPSAFTPNQDGINETFGVAAGVRVQYFSMQVYNKWGQLIFKSNDVNQKWDGTFKGKPVTNGAYLWMITYVNLKGKKIYEQGTVMLIR